MRCRPLACLFGAPWIGAWCDMSQWMQNWVPAPGVPPSLNTNCLSVFYLSEGPCDQSFTQRTLLKGTSQNWTMFFSPYAQLYLHYLLLLLTQAESGSLRWQTLWTTRFLSLPHWFGSTWEGQDTAPRQSSTPGSPASGALLAEPHKAVGLNCEWVQHQ